ncbi:MAG: response regulator [Planctomycetaceae bacterium]|nr:response regulator [Planctomycetaceae bacterium]
MATVLVVDDSAVDRRIVRGLLEHAGDYEVLEAPDGEAALAAVAEREPDVIITDLLMPRMDGFAMVEALKEDSPGIPVILMTGRGSEEIAAKALQHGAASYVAKSRLAHDLTPTVERILSAAREDRTHARLLHHMRACRLEFQLRNDLSLIRAAVNLLQLMLRCLPLADEIERLRVGIALEEALKNAYYHGNLELGGMTPRPPREDYAALAAGRVLTTPYRDRRIHVSAEIGRDEAVFVVRDEGAGFDVSGWLEKSAVLDADAASNRGMSLMRSIMDDVRYNPAGNEVTLHKRAAQPVAAEASLETTGELRFGSLLSDPD